MTPAPYVWEIQETYEKWWLGKYLEDGRQIVEVKYVGNRVYGCGWFKLDDGTEISIPQGHNQYRPRKKWVSQCINLFDDHQWTDKNED